VHLGLCPAVYASKHARSLPPVPRPVHQSTALARTPACDSFCSLFFSGHRYQQVAHSHRAAVADFPARGRSAQQDFLCSVLGHGVVLWSRFPCLSFGPAVCAGSHTRSSIYALETAPKLNPSSCLVPGIRFSFPRVMIFPTPKIFVAA
jgi:hypothetical protein